MCPRPALSNRGSSMNTFEPPPPEFVTPLCLIFRSLCSVKRWGDRLRLGCFEGINQCHCFRHVLFDVKQTRWECRPCCEKRVMCWWRNSILREFANDGPASVSTLLCPVKRLRLWNPEREGPSADGVYRPSLACFKNYIVIPWTTDIFL